MTDERQVPLEGARTLEDEPWFEQAKTLEGMSPSQTIVPKQGTPDPNAKAALTALETASAQRSKGIAAGIELGATLGEGGMGIVRVGTQLALGRPVAVKTLKPGFEGDRATLKVLREAWITGSLEHPNVVPVYDLGVDDEGRPLIVLKKIEGTEWTDLMRDADAVREKFGVHDLFEWNLSILLSVCNAVRFAHARHVLHRDLKPENVMVGEFGEVYVVDWGIAISTKDDGTGRFPVADSATEMAGTPYYMAPEMLGGANARLDERSDVYLLGSILYEIVVGHPPHVGPNLMAVVASVAASEPRVPEEVPDELREILRRAMARDRADRYDSVDDFRLAIIEFLEHRGSMRMATEAEERRAHLAGYIAASSVGDDRARDRIYTLFSECRFGYRSALDAWRDNPLAQDGLRAATEAMIDYELAQGDPRAAAALAAQLPDISPELEAQIEAAAEEKAALQRRLEAAQQQEDQSIGRRTRIFLALLFSIIWTLAPLAIWLTGYEPGWAETFAGPGLLAAGLLGAGFWARESLGKTAFNRRVSGLVFVAFAMQLPLHFGHWLVGMEASESQVQALGLWASALAFAIVTVDRRIWPAFVMTTIGYLLASIDATLRWPIMAINAVVMLVNIAFIWRVEPEDVGAMVEERLPRFTRRPPPPESDP